MGTRSLFALVLGAAVAMSISAKAETFRFPETGDPAFVIVSPDGWTHKPDGDGNMLILAGDSSASLALTIGAFSGTLDELAAGAMKTAGANPPQNMGPTAMSGYRGYMYDTDMTNSHGVHINVHMVCLKLDESHIASATLLTITDATGGQYAAARGVLDDMTLTRAEK